MNLIILLTVFYLKTRQEDPNLSGHIFLNKAFGGFFFSPPSSSQMLR